MTGEGWAGWQPRKNHMIVIPGIQEGIGALVPCVHLSASKPGRGSAGEELCPRLQPEHGEPLRLQLGVIGPLRCFPAWEGLEGTQGCQPSGSPEGQVGQLPAVLGASIYNLFCVFLIPPSSPCRRRPRLHIGSWRAWGLRWSW